MSNGSVVHFSFSRCLYLVPMRSAHPVLVLQYNTTFLYSSKIYFFSPVLLLLHLMWALPVLVQSKPEVLISRTHTHTHSQSLTNAPSHIFPRILPVCAVLNRIIPVFDRPRCVVRTKHTWQCNTMFLMVIFYTHIHKNIPFRYIQTSTILAMLYTECMPWEFTRERERRQWKR